MKVKSESEVAQSRPTLSDPMDCSLPGSSVHGIFQARVLELDAIAFSIFSTPICGKAQLLNRYIINMGSPRDSEGKESFCNAGDLGLIPRLGRPHPPPTQKRKWQPTPVFLPGKSHGQRSLAGYSAWGHKELATTERLTHTLSYF